MQKENTFYIFPRNNGKTIRAAKAHMRMIYDKETMSKSKKCYTIKDCEELEDRLLLVLHDTDIRDKKSNTIIVNLLKILEIEKDTYNTEESNYIIDYINNITKVFESTEEE